MKGIEMVINNIHSEIDALTAAAPNLAVVQLIANLQGISFQDALVGQLRDWCTALDEAVDRSADHAARLVSHGENSAISAQQRQAFNLQAVEYFTEITRFNELRIVATQMLADADTLAAKAPENSRS
jgi:hypothetical protein